MSFLTRWQQLRYEDQCRLFRAYSAHFPIEIRFAFADWIGLQPWFDLDINNPRDKQPINDIVFHLIKEIQIRAHSDPLFESIAQQVVPRYSIEPFILFESIKQCLNLESEIFQNLTNIAGISTCNNTTEQDSEYSTDPKWDNNKKIEDINGRIYKLKMILRQIQQFSSYSRSNNFAKNQFQYYLDLCKKHVYQQNELIIEMLSMKNILMDLLKGWKLAQKSSIIDGAYDRDVSWLTAIQELFSSFFSSLHRTREMLIEFKGYIPIDNSLLVASTSQAHLKIDNLITDLINDSFIIEEQPLSQSSQPLVIITKTKLEAKVRLLIANSNITNPLACQAKVDVRLVNAEGVSLLNNEGIGSLMTKPPICEISNNSRPIVHQSQSRELSATFTDLQIDFKRNRRSSVPVAEEKFTLLFVTKVNILNRDFTLYALSLPIVVVSRYDCDALATVLWDIGFADQERELFSVAEQIAWSQLAQVLNRKFKSETGVGLTDDHLRFIASLIPVAPGQMVYNDQMVSWLQFCKIKLRSRLFTFWQWFHAIMVLTRDILCDLWRDGLIIGFISSEESQQILSQCSDGTFLLRFSESFDGRISIIYKQNGQIIRLLPFNPSDLKANSLPNMIRNFKAVSHLYPNIPKDIAFGKYYTTDDTQIQSLSSHIPYVRGVLELTAGSQIPATFQSDENNSNQSNQIIGMTHLSDQDLADLQSYTTSIDNEMIEYLSSQNLE